jgi:inosine/xanthosine triphosphate pyrophosphatase family protein
MNSIQPPRKKAGFIFEPNFVQPTQNETALALGLSRNQVQAAEASALRKIRRRLERAGFGGSTL